MALDPNKFIIPSGDPSATVQAMQSAAIGPDDVEIRTGSGLWNWLDSTADSSEDPGDCWFSTAQGNIVVGANLFVYISNVDELGEDYGPSFLAAQVDDQFTLVENADAGYGFKVTGAVIDGGDYVKVPVEVVTDLGGNIGKNTRVQIKGKATENPTATQVSNASRQVFGWASYDDSVHTSGSPLELRSGNSHASNLIIDGLGSATDVSHWPDVPEAWDKTNGKMIGTGTGDAYDVRVTLKASDGAAVNFLDLIVDIGGSIGTIYQESKAVAKGAAEETSIAWQFQLYSAATFMANDAQFSIDSLGVDMDIWDIGIMIFRKYEAS